MYYILKIDIYTSITFMNLNILPDEIIFKIMKLVFHSIHNQKLILLNKEFHSKLLDASDIGSIILYRIDGMPLLLE